MVLLGAFEIPLLIESVDARVVQPFTTGITRISAVLIGLIESGTVAHGTMISSPCFAVDIRNGCNGLEATLFLLAAVLAFPATARLKAIGAIAGVATVQLANLVRIVTLFLIGCHKPKWFEAFHLAVWQTVIFAIAVGFFLVWTRRATTADAIRS